MQFQWKNALKIFSWICFYTSTIIPTLLCSILLAHAKSNAKTTVNVITFKLRVKFNTKLSVCEDEYCQRLVAQSKAKTEQLTPSCVCYSGGGFLFGSHKLPDSLALRGHFLLCVSPILTPYIVLASCSSVPTSHMKNTEIYGDIAFCILPLPLYRSSSIIFPRYF